LVGKLAVGVFPATAIPNCLLRCRVFFLGIRGDLVKVAVERIVVIHIGFRLRVQGLGIGVNLVKVTVERIVVIHIGFRFRV